MPDHELELERELTPRQTVAELDRDIVGQPEAKRAVAIALRNRWRRRQLTDDLRKQVTPKNIMLIGPTGVGKTEIARRLAMLVGAPFVKAEATKYTEVGYVGRDVEGLIRDLVEAAIILVKNSERQRVVEPGQGPGRAAPPGSALADSFGKFLARIRDASSCRGCRAPPAFSRKDEDSPARGRAGGPRGRSHVPRPANGTGVDPGAGNFEQMEMDIQGMFEKILPKATQTRRMTVGEARPVLLQQEIDGLIDLDKITQAAVNLAEESGIIFIDEIDKITSDEGSRSGPDVSRQGVQRDLLPIVEGTTVNTKHGPVKTDHVLFIAAGAFHRSKPSDLMPELQGRFPIRVEMHDLTRDDFARILREPRASLLRQYQALLATEGITLEFADAAIEVMADLAYKVNRTTQNIGARRLHTILERVLEELSFDASDRTDKHVVVDETLVRERLEALTQDEDLSRFIL